MRVTRSDPELPLAQRGERITVQVDGRPVAAYAGETVAALLLAEGIRTFRHTAKSDEPRSLFCGIGICYDCLVNIDGVPNIRACVTALAPGMLILTRAG
jgi:predicted molibdopterin-dependent oxidoreductase YjgC